MTKLTQCIKKAGKALSRDDRKALLDNVNDGASEADAVTAVLSEARNELQVIIEYIEAAGGEVKRLTAFERLRQSRKAAKIAPEDTTKPQQSVTIETAKEVTSGVQTALPSRDAGTGAEAVQPAEKDRGVDSARQREIAGSAPDVRRTDGERAEAGERTAGTAVPEGSRGTGTGRADRVPERARAERPAREAARVTGTNFRIEPGSLAEDRGRVQKAKDNMRAIKLMREIEASGRPATQGEQIHLARYVGWGGLKGAFPDADGKFEKGFEAIGAELKQLLSDTEYATARRSLQYAHYTAENVVNTMWAAAERMGFKGGKVFEPGMGVGNFAGLMPAELAEVTDYSGLELDHTTARIARLLYPQWGVRQDDFTRAPLPKDTFDFVIGNPPFADIPIKSDAKYPQGFLLHDYFFAKSMDAVRPGGLLAFVSSAGTMNKQDARARNYLAERADLVGAIRLPSTAFKQTANTEVTTDILFFRKRLEGEPVGDTAWVDTTKVTLPGPDKIKGLPTRGYVNRYFVDNPDMVLGQEGFFDKLYEGRYAVRAPKDFNLDAKLREALGRLPENVMGEWIDTTGRADIDFGTQELKEGSFYVDGERLMQRIDGVGRPVEARGKGVKGGKTKAEFARIKALVPIRDALRAVYAADLAEDTDNATTARKRLNAAYDAFVAEFGPINKAKFQYRRPTIVQQEAARSVAREEARFVGNEWHEGSFDATAMIEDGATTTAIAKARKAVRERLGDDFDEGSFDPSDMPDTVIDKRPNVDAFMDDPESYRLRAIEWYDDNSGESKKTEVFERNIIRREVTPDIKSVNDALLYVLNQNGRLDIAAIAKAAKVSESQAIEELGDNIFRLPGTENRWDLRDAYLSGNVRHKLRVARVAAERDPRLQRNVEALEAAQPAPLPPSEISANLGMPWLPTEIIEEFGTKQLKLNILSVSYISILAQWKVAGDKSSAAANATWGTKDRSAPELIQDALNRQSPRIYTKLTIDGRQVSQLDVAATEAAQDKLKEIKQQFSDWVWSDPDRAQRLAELYNEEYNSLIAREYDGGYLTTPGVTSKWQWRPHQSRVMARIIQDGNTYMAHGVGSGKTSAMIGAGMEMRRLGLARKPMYTVPNHMLGQFTKEFYELYPTARIMIADERQFHTSRRKQFIANAANEDLDAIIITHSAFGMIPISEEFQDGLIQQEIAKYREVLSEIDEDQENRITRGRIEKQIERMEQRLSGKSKRTDQVFTFEEMGVDFLFVDEAHLFRKLDFATKMSSVKGISPEGSKASWDLFVKTRYLETINPGHNLVLASGTPVTNTMAELFTVSRYLQPQQLKERGLEHFDAWAGAFGDSVARLEQNAAGGYQEVTRFAKFVNVPELSVMVRQNMDVVTGRQLDQYVTRPKLKGGQRQMNLAEKDDALENYQLALDARLTAIQNRRGPPEKGDDIILSVINDGRHAAIDMRLVNSDLPNNPGSKLNLLVDNLHKIWQDTKRKGFHQPNPGGTYSAKPIDKGPATQLVFANLGLSGKRGFSVPDYIRNELVRRGVPKKQIALIADYKTHVAKQRLFNDINEGKIRILVGSTAKMATGVNVQRRLYALHNLDPLWYPADDEQRNGRALRQGNLNPEIEIHDYSTKGTYDSTMWGLMETKARFIQGFFEGDPNLRDMEDLGEASQYEQAKAMTTADPRLIELTELRQNLERAQRRKSSFEREQYANRQRVVQAEDRITYFEKRIPNIERDLERRQDTKGDNFTATINGKQFDERVEAGDHLLGSIDLMRGETKDYRDHKIGEMGGFDIVVDVWGKDRFAAVAIRREDGFTTEARLSDSAVGVMRSLEYVLESFDADLTNAKQKLQQARDDVREFTPETGKEFAGQAEIDELRQKVRDLETELAPKAPESPPEEKLSLRPEVFSQVETLESDLKARLEKVGIADKVAVNVVDRIRSMDDGAALSGAEGRYFGRMIEVAADSPNGPWVMDHEIIHALRDLNVIRSAEWTTLSKAAAARLEEIRKRYAGRNLSEEQLIEEAIADMHADWSTGQREAKGFVRRAFERIRDFLEALGNAIRGLGFESSGDVFRRIDRGEVGRRRGWPGEEPRPPKYALKAGDFDPKRAQKARIKFDNPESERRWQEARKGVRGTDTLLTQMRQYFGNIGRGFARHFIHLPNEARFSEAREQLRKIEAAPQASKEEALRVLRTIVDGMSAKDLDLFTRKVVLDDLSHEVDQQHQLPFGMTPKDVERERVKVDAALRPELHERVKLRNRLVSRVANELVRSGVLSREQIQNPAYYRHQVLDYARAQVQYAKTPGKKLKAPHWARRMGSRLDINANLLEAEFEWLQKALNDIAVADSIEWFRRSDYNRRDETIASAKAHNQALIEKVIQRDMRDNGYMQNGRQTSPLNEQWVGFKQRIAVALKEVRGTLESGNVTDIPSELEGAAIGLMTETDEGSIFPLLSWMIDNDKPGAGAAAGAFKAINQRKAWVRAMLGKQYADPMQLEELIKRGFAPEGYKTWQPDEGNLLFTAKTIPERVLDRMLSRIAEEDAGPISKEELSGALESVRSMLAVGGPKYQMVLPEEVANSLNSLKDEHIDGIIESVFAVPMRFWKRWVLINPRRVIKYNLNNLSGDLDAVIAGNPQALKKLPQAIRELWQVMIKGKTPSQTYRDAVDRGVFDSGLTIQEIPDINYMQEFEQLIDPPSPIRHPLRFTGSKLMNVWRALQRYTWFRENWMRYAAYLDYVERLEAGESMRSIGYGAGKREMVDAISDPKDRAALLARELVGDYGAISEFGKGLRRKVIPFYSWMEINTKRYWRFGINAWDQGIAQGARTTGLLGATLGIRTTAYLFMRMAMLYGMVQLWNNLVMGDEEDELSTEERVRLHIILGRDSDGNIRTLRFQGALSDFLGWIGFGDAIATTMEVEKGRADAMEVVETVAKAPVNRVLNGLTPVLSAPIEYLSGKKFWPDVFRPRPIRDRVRNLSQLFSLEHEYDVIFDRPSRGYTSSVEQTVVYKRNIGENSYNRMKGMTYDWLRREKGLEGSGGYITPRSQALYEWRLAKKFGDTKAERKAFETMRELGVSGTDIRASIKRAHPLGGLSLKDRGPFLKTLTRKERDMLDQAIEWYNEVYID